MDHLQSIFLTEAIDLIGDLEKALLDFEKDLNNQHCVREIFRVMHTLKGSASMFGFDTLSALTHDLETIYDSIREGHSEPTAEILEVTLQSVDHLKALMYDADLEKPKNQLNHERLCGKIREMLNTAANSGHSVVNDTSSKTESTYYVYAKPQADLFKNGNNPLFLIDDLASLGHALVLPHFDQVPNLHDIEADICYTSFEVILVTNSSVQHIRDIFLFVEDNCEIIIGKIDDGDLLCNSSFINTLEAKDSLDKPPFGFALVRAIAGACKANLANESKTTQPQHAKAEKGTSIRVASDKLDELMNLVSELVTTQAQLTVLAGQHGTGDLINISENVEKITRRLRDNAFTICLVPIETLVTRFQRLVRDLARELGKEIDFTAEGTETELDRSIIEKVTDPILHILRNCIDHGIEFPDERMKNGKDRQGKIQLKAFHSGTHVYIQIKDDGKGIDPEAIKRKAIDRGLINADVVVTENEILELVFSAGFTTAEKVTDVSGRGVGMDIVKRNIEALHGEVSLQTQVNHGTTLTLKLPLTLSILDGMLVQIGSSQYILPLSIVEKCYEIETQKINKDVAQKHVFDGTLLPVFNLHQVFRENSNRNKMTQVIKINYDEFPVGLTVDHIIGEYQAVLKPLGEMYQQQDEFSGATILGDGTVALVVDTDKLVKDLCRSALSTL